MSEDLRKPLKFIPQNGGSFTRRLVLSTLTGRTILISQIRPTSTDPGLRSHEISFLRLLEAVTNGSHIEISYSSTTLLYRPGLVTGSAPGSGASSGGVIKHEIPRECERGISYFLIPLCILAPFSKAPVNIVFTGPGVITSSTPSGDMSVDTVRTAILPLYAQFGITNNIELKILKRSNPGPGGKGGGGEVHLVFGHQIRLPKTIHQLNGGRVKKIRGIAYCTGVSASNNARMIEAARGVLNPMTGDTYIFSDVSSAPLVSFGNQENTKHKKKIGLGFGLSLVAETSTGCLFSADLASSPEGGETAEDIGQKCAYQLLENLSLGGTVSFSGAATVILLMAMGSEDVGRVQVGKEVLATEEMVGFARDLKVFGASGWGIRDAGGTDNEVVVSIVGRGVGNVGRKIA